MASEINFSQLPPAALPRSETEFLRRGKPAEKEQLMREISKLPRTEPDDLEAMKDTEAWHRIAGKYEAREQHLRILKAYVDGDLDEYQASRLFHFDTCLDVDPGATVHLLHGDGAARNWELLENAFPSWGKEFWQAFPNFLDEQKISLADRQFYVIRTQLRSIGLDMPLVALELQTKFQSCDLGVRLINKKAIQTILLPLRVSQAKLDLRFRKNAVRLFPALGCFEIKEKFFHTNSRVVSFPCRLIKTPMVLHHNIDAKKGPGAPSHDSTYHGLLLSFIGEEHRAMWDHLGTAEELQLTLKQKSLIADKDFTPYAFGNEISGPSTGANREKFWYTLLELIQPFSPLILGVNVGHGFSLCDKAQEIWAYIEGHPDIFSSVLPCPDRFRLEIYKPFFNPDNCDEALASLQGLDEYQKDIALCYIINTYVQQNNDKQAIAVIDLMTSRSRKYWSCELIVRLASNLNRNIEDEDFETVSKKFNSLKYV